MSSRRGRRIASGTALLALGALVAAGISFFPELRERYYLRELGSGTEAERETAVRRLGELRSEAAVPALVDLVDAEDELSLLAVESLFRIGKEGIQGFRERFKAAPATFRLRAVEAIVGYDFLDESAIPFLTWVTLHDPFEKVRSRAAHRGLERFGEKAVPGLVAGLDTSDREVEKNALTFLGVLGDKARAAVPSVFAVVRENGSNATRAASALAYIGKASIPALVEALSDPDERIRRRATWGLRRMQGAGAAAVPALIEALDDEAHLVREGVVAALAAIGPAADEAIPALLRALRSPTFGHREERTWFGRGDPRWNVRASIPRALTAIAGPDQEEDSLLVRALIESLSDANPCVTLAAIRALGEIGPRAASAVPRLRAFVEASGESEAHGKAYLRDCDEQYGVAAAEALSKIGDDVARTVQTLAEALTSNDAALRGAAVRSLGELGPEARGAIPALVATLGDEALGLPPAAAAALGKVGEAAIPALLEALTDDSARIRGGAAYALGSIGEAREEVISRLLENLSDADAGVRCWVAWALGRFGAGARPALEDLIGALGDENEGVRSLSASALRNIGRDAKEAIPALVKMLEEAESERISTAAARALGTIVQGETEAVTALARTMLGDDDPVVRFNAAAALRRIGPFARDAIPALIEALRDTARTGYHRAGKRLTTRDEALGALRTMGSERVIPELEKAAEHGDPETREAVAKLLETMRAER